MLVAIVRYSPLRRSHLMSLFEWLGESWDPGDVGGCEVGARGRETRPRWVVLFFFVLAAALLSGAAYALWFQLQLRSGQFWLFCGTATLLYLLLGYFVHPEPDFDNVGWFGGMMDHPFRYSDDANRFLLFLMVALFPGRLLAESLWGGLRLVGQLAFARER
jgi:hypothetical protein